MSLSFDILQNDAPLSAEENSPSTSQATALPVMAEESEVSSPPPSKRSAMAEVFGSLFSTVEGNQPTLEQRLKEEVCAYMAKKCTSVDSDPLSWWKCHESLYPNLAVLAKSYLAIPATSVPSERVFSTAGDIVTATRSALSTDSVDKLVFLKKNLKVE